MSLPQAFIDLCNGAGVATQRAARDFNAMAATVNAATQRGPVPIAEVASYCCTQGITGGVMALLEIPVGASDNPPASLSVPTKGMLHTVLTLIQIDFRLTECDTDDPAFAQACAGLISLGVLTTGQRDALLALGNNRRGQATAILGRDCTPSECLEACGGA